MSAIPAKHARIDPTRIDRRVRHLTELTEAERPYTRRAFTDLYLEARSWLEQEFREAGLTPSLDAGANLHGTRPGAEAGLPALTLGSHIDTVPNGGRFDGIAGVITALEAAQALAEAGATLRHELRVIDFLSEEPSDYGASCVGSRALAGTLTSSMLAGVNASGETLAEGIARMGGEPGALTGPLVREGELAAFMELHIEQGPVLERENVPIGVVGGIVAIHRLQVHVTGRAAHAGTSPMDGRRDALVGAARLVDRVSRRARIWSDQEPFVATIGRLNVRPGGANVVPGEVSLTLEARALDEARVVAFLQEIMAWAEKACGELGLNLRVEEGSTAAAVHCAPEAQRALVAGCEARGHGYRHLNSGAGHDAMQVANVAPVGMIFIPCVDGVSHHPDEEASLQDMVAGAEVFAEALTELDAR
ncbi:MAG: Zn-dependent hydrolase [Trueperaceae bacterium]|nr:Zn-dependent hydrolase [Trueperaceae bacterium]